MPRQATVLLYRTWLAWLTMLLLAMGSLLLTASAFLLHGPPFWLSITVQLSSAVAFLLTLTWPVQLRGLLGADRAGVSLDGALVIPASRVRQAVRISGPGSTSVRVSRRRAWHADVELAFPPDADDLLLALAQDSGRTTATFPAWLGGRNPQGVIALAAVIGLLSLVALVVGRDAVYYLAFIFPVLALATSASRSSTLVVGADGVLVRRLLRRPAFYPYRELHDFARDGADIVITHVSASPTRYGLGSPLKSLGGEAPAVACMARIAETRARCLAGDGPADLAEVLSPAERDVGAWHQGLLAILGTPTTYRTSSVPVARLWAALVDPTQPEAVRAGAAVALRPALDDEGKGRLRVAAASCASESLRKVFLAAETEDDDAVEGALASVKAMRRS